MLRQNLSYEKKCKKSVLKNVVDQKSLRNTALTNVVCLCMYKHQYIGQGHVKDMYLKLLILIFLNTP